jgi:methyl-accepting chemotaxis protein
VNTRIANATEEQSAVTQEISARVIDISRLSNEVAQIITETSVTAENSSRLALHLQGLVSRFRV